METAAQLLLDADDLAKAKREAGDNETATMADEAWAKTFTAANHAKLVDRNLFMADASQQLAALYTARSREDLAMRARDDAERYAAIAERHRKASEEDQEEGEKLGRDARARNGRRRPSGGRGNGRRQTPPATPSSTG